MLPAWGVQANRNVRIFHYYRAKNMIMADGANATASLTFLAALRHASPNLKDDAGLGVLK